MRSSCKRLPTGVARLRVVPGMPAGTWGSLIPRLHWCTVLDSWLRFSSCKNVRCRWGRTPSWVLFLVNSKFETQVSTSPGGKNHTSRHSFMFCVKTATVALPGVLGRQTEPLSQKWPKAPISANRSSRGTGGSGGPTRAPFSWCGFTRGPLQGLCPGVLKKTTP